MIAPRRFSVAALLTVLVQSPARAEVYEAQAIDNSGYAVFEAGGAHVRALGGTVLAPGQAYSLPAELLAPGDYKLRITTCGERSSGVGDLTAVVVDESTQQRRSFVLATEAPRFHVRRKAKFHVELTNRARQQILVSGVAFLVRRDRAPVQVILYVPDAHGFFPETHPQSAFGHFADQGEFHSRAYSSGDNTYSFTRTFLIRATSTSSSAFLTHIRQKNIPTAVIADNFYLMSNVANRWFDFMWIRDVAATSDQEINQRAIDWVRQHHDEDFVLYSHVLADHDYGYTLRETTTRSIVSTVDALRTAAPGAILMLTPDHGTMHDHSWWPDKYPGGQGWGLYSDTAHVPFLALGPGIPHGARCDHRWSFTELRDTLARIDRGNTTPLLELLDCHRPTEPDVVSEGFQTQISLTEERYHYIRYEPSIPSPGYSTITHRRVRDGFLRHEALYDDQADPHETRSIGAEQPEVLARLRRRALNEYAWRATQSNFGKRRLRLLWLSKTCTAPPGPLSIHANGAIDVVPGGSPVSTEGTPGGMDIVLHPPFCFAELTIELGNNIDRVDLSLPDSDFFLGRGYIKQRAAVRFEGSQALGLLADWSNAGYGDVFVQNHARPGLYVFLEQGAPRPAAAPVPKPAAAGATAPENVSRDEVRRMMRSWGYMREAELSDLQ